MFFWSDKMTGGINEIVILPEGQVKGSSRNPDGVLAFKGIPYAAPPVGNFRWRPPQAVLPWKGERDATHFGPSAYSALPNWPTATEQSEDCLTVNVWTAARQQRESRPVMLWIHGGGFQFGSSADPIFDGARLANEGVVLVSCNYRVGVLGFLALPELDNEASPSGNYGLQDQIAALGWVQRNIALFGGDPRNVTVFGESAGAHAIGLLMASPLCPGLFHRAILQSGAYWDTNHGPLSSFQEARERGAALCKKLGAASVADLRNMSASEVNAAALWRLGTDPARSAFSPNVDGFVVPEAPASVFSQGRQMKVPVMAGWNAAEWLPFVALAPPHDTAAAFRSAAQSRFDGRAEDFLSHYAADTDAEAAASAKSLIGDLIISQQTWDLLDTHCATAQSPVYAYYYTFTSPYSPVAAHAADQDFVFGNLLSSRSFVERGAPGQDDREFSRRLVTFWTNFAKQSDPNENRPSQLACWPRYNCDDPSVLELGTVIKPMDYPLGRFRFLRSLRLNGALPTSWRDIDMGVSEQ